MAHGAQNILRPDRRITTCELVVARRIETLFDALQHNLRGVAGEARGGFERDGVGNVVGELGALATLADAAGFVDDHGVGVVTIVIAREVAIGELGNPVAQGFLQCKRDGLPSGEEIGMRRHGRGGPSGMAQPDGIAQQICGEILQRRNGVASD